MRVNDACMTTAASLSPGSRCWLAVLCWFASACHFDAQPLFEPYGADVGGRSNQPLAPKPGDAQVPAIDVGAADSGVARDAGIPPSRGVSDAAVCAPQGDGACDGGQLLTCAADSGAMLTQDCGAAGCNADAKRCNVCRPGALSCSDGKLIRCAADGSASSEEVCAMGCIATGPDSAACRKCADGPAVCQDGNLVQCAPDGQSSQSTRCERGCDDRTHTCNGTLVPANIPADACRWTDFADTERTIEGQTTLDTERDCPRVIRQGSGLPDLCVLAFERLRIARDATVSVTGERALVLLATRSIEIDGRLSASARGTEAGAGSLDGGNGLGRNATGRVQQGEEVDEWTNLPANAGGGGAGHATPGGLGGGAPGQCGPNLRCAEAGEGGERYGTETLKPLQGGSIGGENSAAEWSTRRGKGGGGGGALQLVACQELKLGRSAVIDANGGGGEGGFPGAAEMDSETPGAGAGGGSGGAILVQARVLSVEAGALLVANGGGGGGGATRTASGSSPMVAGSNGQDGQLSEAAATGGQGAADSLPGGAGGAKDPPGDGGRARQTTVAAGGGGGAAGRIRIETAAQPGPRAGLGVSPLATYGTVAVE